VKAPEKSGAFFHHAPGKGAKANPVRVSCVPVQPQALLLIMQRQEDLKSGNLLSKTCPVACLTKVAERSTVRGSAPNQLCSIS